MRNVAVVLVLCIGGALLGFSDKTSAGAKPAAATSEGAKPVAVASESAKPVAITGDGAKQAAANIASAYEKNGFPCLAELCIDDGISELQNIQWQSVEEKDIKRATRTGTLGDIKLGLRGNIPAEAIPFLKARKFDATVLPMILGIVATCTSDYGSSSDYSFLDGKYVSNNGNKTEVRIQLLPKSVGSTEQQWTVSYMRRFVETPMNDQDVEAAEHQLAERYKKFITINSYGYTGEENEKSLYRFNSPFGSSSQGFDYNLELKDRQPRMPMPPQCANKVNID